MHGMLTCMANDRSSSYDIMIEDVAMRESAPAYKRLPDVDLHSQS
jgi:hypothetical protein